MGSSRGAKMPRRQESKGGQAEVLISLETLPYFDQYVVTWFVNVASQYLLGHDIEELAKLARNDRQSLLEKIYNEAINFVNAISSNIKGNICEMPSPLPLTNNDRRELFNICKAIELLEDACRGNIEKIPMPPALSFEFSEYVRIYMPKVAESTKKRNIVMVSSEILAMVVLGAFISRAYVSRSEYGSEYGYVFATTINPRLINVKKLNGMVRSVTEAVMNGDGSKITLLAGVASAIVLNVGKKLHEDEGRSYYSSIRIFKGREGGKTMLKAFETLDMTDLARTVMRLGIASALYNLIIKYPSGEEIKRDKKARTLRSIIEELSKAVLKYHYHNDLLDIYRVIRTATTGETYSEIKEYLGDVWIEALNDLLGIRVL